MKNKQFEILQQMQQKMCEEYEKRITVLEELRKLEQKLTLYENHKLIPNFNYFYQIFTECNFFETRILKLGECIAILFKNRIEIMTESGFLIQTFLSFKIHNQVLKIMDIQVSTLYQNQGVGTLMIDTLLNYCKVHSINEITGDILESDYNKKLKYFYKKFGFEIIENQIIKKRVSD